MSQQISIPTALSIPAPDIEALIEGRNIAAISPIFLNPGRQFALYPADTSRNVLETEQYYCPSFLPTAQKTLAKLDSEKAIIQGWAKCELCQTIDNLESLAILSQLTVWTEEGLQEIISQRGHIFLAYLRVYRLPKPVEIPINQSPRFIPIAPPLTVTDANPVFSDRNFAQRRHQLENLLPPPHPELEALQTRIGKINHTDAQKLDDEIKKFLGWTTKAQPKLSDPKLAWIKDIVTLGERSKEIDEKKSNYQAGTDFENIVRDSLNFIGFTVDEAYKGGAGGLDLFCSKPYPLVGECKAGKGIPSRSAEELIKLGGMRLNEEQFQNSAKLIVGPGKPSKDVLTAASKFKISIIEPMTLQKLVELYAKYPGSVNLIELKHYLVAGKIDDKIDEYVELVEKTIKLRSHIVNQVKTYLENSGFSRASVDALHGSYIASNPPQPLQPQELHEILLELSSPLTGYLGREKGKNWQSDRFYFLRNLS
ncbi:MAG TPA: DUF1802 domain-containing protein [Cyanobacteria bacterium UBA11149]|nr:DUF1802 domain-containing protein [Cyanobacteria bacterium UBA11367]HBE59309.1 DUF1802 domain-containing protein [Cyanobacteria bacterium UBA11366]HBK63696.1 DUF1802 domain-containing protein [Cyanobacteria bacterium UBA11166]HBR75751.1 DUF1802 domain-containing protein [Cyanobacteria bacterium UBA11159]HBS70938.1 DUF1802 domain-containing protein [Cyanobacteria bacterium UBA11153]HBW89423.1 DUF1802 domain-containing protein [Cyanobacteria bacterium UBA11149]HCA96838.1 DUF1802 domain-conta